MTKEGKLCGPWIFDDRPDTIKNENGWTGTYGLPRSLWLGEDGTLRMRPVKELEQLRLKEQAASDVLVESGKDVSMDGLGHPLMELEITWIRMKQSNSV